MGFEQLIQAFGPSALPAVAILIAVRMMLRSHADQLRMDREQHEREIDKLIQSHTETAKGIIEGLSNLRESLYEKVG